MKKIISMIIVFCFLMSCMTGCGKDNEIKVDLQKYISDLALIQGEHDLAVNTYNSYFSGQSNDPKVLLQLLNDTIIPTYDEYLISLDAVVPVTEEVKALKVSLSIPEEVKVIGHIGAFSAPKNHFYLLKIIENYLKTNHTLTDMKTDSLSEANTKLADAAALYEEYKKALSDLAIENDIVITTGKANEEEIVITTGEAIEETTEAITEATTEATTATTSSEASTEATTEGVVTTTEAALEQ